MKNFLKISPFIMFLISCSRFPYSGVISESKRWVKKTHPEFFQKLIIDQEDFHILRSENKEKPLLILVHGSPGDWGSFAHFFKDKALLENYELITFSRYGFGKNREGVPHGKLDDQIKPLVAIIDKYKMQRKVILLGHSYGGPVVMKLALTHPDKVDALVLAAASMDPELEKMKWYQYVAEAWPIRHLIPSVLDVTNREILALKEEMIHMESDYKSFNKPLYVVQGDIDVLVPKENVDYIVRKTGLSDTYIERIKNAKHFLPWAFPESLKRGILKVTKDISHE